MNTENDDLQDGMEEGRGGTGGRFLSIRDGKFVERVADGTEGASPRVLKMGKNDGTTVHEKFYGVLTGKIEGMYMKDPRIVNFGDGDREVNEAVLIFRVGDGVVNIDLGDGNQHFTGFVKCLPNIDLKRKVRLSPYNYTQKGSGAVKVGMGVTQAPTEAQKASPETKYEQDGTVKVPWYWTKENPRKLPEPQKFFNPKTKKEELIWEAHDAYLRSIIAYYGEKMKTANDAELAQTEATTPAPAAPAPAPTKAAPPVQAAHPMDDMEEDQPPFADFGAGGASEEDSLPF